MWGTTPKRHECAQPAQPHLRKQQAAGGPHAGTQRSSPKPPFSDTQWYKNVLKNPAIRTDAGGAEAELHALPVTEAPRVASVVEKFRDKYGAQDVTKYYSKLDVAVLADLH